MRSGLYPQKKSTLYFRPDSRSITGTQTSSVAPGYTVDSNTTMSPLRRVLPTVRLAESSGPKSGRRAWSIGVGTVTM